MPSAPDTPSVPLAATPAAERLAGGPLAGTSAADLVRRLAICSPDGGAITPAELPACRALAGEAVPARLLEITAADGTARAVLVSAAPVVEDGRVTGAFSIWRDVTQRIRAEEALAESEADARSFMASRSTSA